MRVLQITSDWKWTGPAEPMLNLGLAMRELGVEVEFAFPAPPDRSVQSLAERAAKREQTSAIPLRRGRGLRPVADRGDVRSLRRFFGNWRPDLVHCWHTRDHLLALCARGPGLSPKVVRSLRDAEPLSRAPWNRWLFGPGCDGLLCVSPKSAQRNRALRGSRPLCGRHGSVDLERFSPAPGAAATEGARLALGLNADHAVVGIVARMQPHRRFDLLLDAAAILFSKMPKARLLIVGRGTRRREVAEAPAQQRGIADRVHFAGYRDADFVSVLRTVGVFTFLVPGSDGHCRALLEAQACGIPAVTTRRGALPEIVRDGETGLVVDENAEALAAAWERLLRDAALRSRFAEASRARAMAEFRPEDYARDTLAFYREVLETASV